MLWRSPEELAGEREYPAELRDEFPQGASVWPELEDPPSRRAFLHLMGASLALAGLGACTKLPPEKIIPYVTAPEDENPDQPLFFASSDLFGGFARGTLVESHEGRPTKIEPNPAHPAGAAGSDIFMQASVLSLYDPDRAKAVSHEGEPSTWDRFNAELSRRGAFWRKSGGSGLRILSGTVTSPTLARAIEDLLSKYPNARWHQYEPFHRDAGFQAARIAFGEPLEPILRFGRARVILSLDSDFLCDGPGHLRYALEFIQGRRVRAAADARMNRLYVAEPSPTITGAMADHRARLRADRLEPLACVIARELGIDPGGPATDPEREVERDHRDWIEACVSDLRSSPGTSLVVAGDRQPARLHLLAHAINDRLGNHGKTVAFIEPVEARPVDHIASLRELAADMSAGRVETLLILGGNPAYDAPADLRFVDSLRTVPLRIHLGLYEDETSRFCHWHLPQAHELESWGDARSFEGTVSLVQPLISPLYNGKTALEVIHALSGDFGLTGYEALRRYWSAQPQARGAASLEDFWRAALEKGFVAGTAPPERPVALRRGILTIGQSRGPVPEPEKSLELVIRPDPTVWDGRFSNNGWLQELSKPIYQLSWENAVVLSPRTAARLGVATGTVVNLFHKDAKLVGPVLIVPGQADDCVTIHTGYGRTAAGRVGNGRGFNAFPFQHSDSPYFGHGVAVVSGRQSRALALSHEHQQMEKRAIIRFGGLDAFREDPRLIVPAPTPRPDLMADYPYKSYAWAMSIDLNACIGCKACVVACQAENNIPVVGSDQVMRGRAMHWLRVDRYFEGAAANPRAYFQPVPCMHCEKAPCELVCPTGATLHDDEGINQMVYNRCVGTRYCSNNCPYKVRRFNFFYYSRPDLNGPTKLQKNPEVTIRSRGVMEKCTYCIQRINAARVPAEIEDRRIRDGEIKTACQQACPTEAIVFGDRNDASSAVARLKKLPLNYNLLEELNTYPRTSYLARLRNTNPLAARAEEKADKESKHVFS